MSVEEMCCSGCGRRGIAGETGWVWTSLRYSSGDFGAEGVGVNGFRCADCVRAAGEEGRAISDGREVEIAPDGLPAVCDICDRPLAEVGYLGLSRDGMLCIDCMTPDERGVYAHALDANETEHIHDIRQ